MRRGGQTGFTLIEITLVMAISAMMLFLLLGQHRSVDNSSFMSGMDSLRDSLAAVKNQAVSTVNKQGCGGDGSCNSVLGNSGFYYIAWGKGAEIQNNTIKIYTIKARVDGVGNLQNPVQTILESTSNLKDSLIASAHVCIAFLRDPRTGGLETSFPGCGGNWPNQPDQYPLAAAPLTVNLTGPQSQHGRIIINPNGAAITRSVP